MCCLMFTECRFLTDLEILVSYCNDVLSKYFRDRHSVKTKKQKCLKQINIALFLVIYFFKFD